MARDESLPGFVRQWVRCRTCRRLAYYDYQPYSLSNPVRTLPCGHGLTQRFSDTVVNVDAEVAEAEMRFIEEMDQAVQDLVEGRA
jgi:DNA-directed RNA polymerase subunit N (RpoN/RPB10)